ncbi:MAG: hypothetical protein NT015_05920 [Alphaproteobacteria bacterium]|nr:hypothetical protein [Alphaproteobacteria bacterium]
MPIVMRHNESLELTRVDFFGKLLPEHVRGYGAYGMANPHWAEFDTMTFVAADTDVSGISPADIDGFFTTFGHVLRASNKMVRRRTGWVCDNDLHQAVLAHWLTKRNANVEPDAHVRLFVTGEAASEWLLLNPSAAAALQSGDGFTELARFDGASALAR